MLFGDVTRTYLFRRVGFFFSHFFIKHGIEFIFFVYHSISVPSAPTLPLGLYIMPQLDFIWDLSSKEVTGCLFWIEIVPFGVHVIVFIEGGEVASWAGPILVIVLLGSILIILPGLLIVTTLALIWSCFVLESH